MLGLDFETYGTRDIRKVGLANYLADPEFRVLLAGTKTTSGPAEDFDFVTDPTARDRFEGWLGAQSGSTIAHNAGFERGVLEQMGFKFDNGDIRDSAVVARCMGASSSLEQAAAQLLPTGNYKMAEGKRLIQKFSVPTKEGRCLAEDMHAAGTLQHDPDWMLFRTYVRSDARLGLDIYHGYRNAIRGGEHIHERITHEMNQAGWRVDMKAVREMQRRYEENLEQELASFHTAFDPLYSLNLNSMPQLKEWCAVRGVKTTSFDEAHVTALIGKLLKKLEDATLPLAKRNDYLAVLEMLRTKQSLGGASLKKLKVLMEQVSEDGRLRNSYMHVGAGQSYRTSGRGVQMQNLKRLPPQPLNMGLLYEDTVHWTNDDLAENLRQVFTATHEDGALIVGDFASVESRGLAWLAGAQWKLDAFKAGKDLYKVQAENIYHVPYDQVTKAQRQTGKVGELSCGYGAGPGAVQAFAAKMGVVMTLEEATSLVNGWRGTNPEIVELWSHLDGMLHAVLANPTPVQSLRLTNGWSIELGSRPTPPSLEAQHAGAVTIQLRVADQDDNTFLSRMFQGCYLRGRSVCYYKPSSLVNGNSWSSHFVDPATKQRKYWSIYGGKLTGILTQSFCREMFFDSLRDVDSWARNDEGVTIVGQFHDEIVLDYDPHKSAFTVGQVADQLERSMSRTPVKGFPLSAEVHYDYRYIK